VRLAERDFARHGPGLKTRTLNESSSRMPTDVMSLTIV
jgi:hypothetical protein